MLGHSRSRIWRRSRLIPPRGVQSICSVEGLGSTPDLLATKWTNTTSEQIAVQIKCGFGCWDVRNGLQINFANCCDDSKSHSRFIPVGKLRSVAANHGGVKGQARLSRRFKEIRVLSQGKREACRHKTIMQLPRKTFRGEGDDGSCSNIPFIAITSVCCQIVSESYSLPLDKTTCGPGFLKCLERLRN